MGNLSLVSSLYILELAFYIVYTPHHADQPKIGHGVRD